MRTRTVYSRTLIMKKILSALMLAAGMSLSATAATTLLDSSIVGYSDFASRLADFGTQKDSVAITTDGGNLVLSGTTFSQPVSGGNTRNNMTVTMVLDLSKINTPEAYTALFNAKGGSTSWGAGNNAAYSGGPTTSALGTEGTLTISVVTGGRHPHLPGRQCHVPYCQRPEIRRRGYHPDSD